MSKMDGVATRTAADLEQKLNLGKRFAEVMGIATDARETAEKAVNTLDEKLTPEEIFNALTNNGSWQGIYRDDDGNVYINAEYIDTCYFTERADVYLVPTETEIDTLHNHILGKVTIPADKQSLYDLNGDGSLSITDFVMAKSLYLGQGNLDNWKNKVLSKVTLTIDLRNPDKIIRIQGTNMWGNAVDRFIGVNFTNIKNAEIADYIIESGISEDGWTYEKWSSGTAKCYKKLDSSCDVAKGTSSPNGTNSYYVVKQTAMPFPFRTPPMVFATACDGGTGLATASDDGSTETNCSVCIWGNSEETASGDVNVMVVGKWKW